MTSHPPSTCCIFGVKHEGEPTERMGMVGKYNAYFSYPREKANGFGVVLFPDFMGYELNNAKLLADQFAANGYLTVIPDIWEGDNVPLNWEPTSSFNLGQWMSKHGPEKVEPICEAAINAMRSEHGMRKLAGAGYCLGAKYVSRFMASGRGLDVGYFAHPSATGPVEIKSIAGPLSIAAAQNDALFPPAKRYETEDILKEMKIPYQLNLYSDVDHGFALKADLSIHANKFACETAFLQAVNWFNEYLKMDGT